MEFFNRKCTEAQTVFIKNTLNVHFVTSATLQANSFSELQTKLQLSSITIECIMYPVNFPLS